MVGGPAAAVPSGDVAAVIRPGEIRVQLGHDDVAAVPDVRVHVVVGIELLVCRPDPLQRLALLGILRVGSLGRLDLRLGEFARSPDRDLAIFIDADRGGVDRAGFERLLPVDLLCATRSLGGGGRRASQEGLHSA